MRRLTDRVKNEGTRCPGEPEPEKSDQAGNHGPDIRTAIRQQVLPPTAPPSSLKLQFSLAEFPLDKIVEVHNTKTSGPTDFDRAYPQLIDLITESSLGKTNIFRGGRVAKQPATFQCQT
ncbi:hypothetical protein AA0312_1318 [Acetobacter tropicalis NRIC 0312]|nr:hypothetical protein ATR1_031c0018 [Acetobacter tropicalis]GBR25820.1 hypothetical protein AA0488_0749 [Kozakia baliensis NRIC 0488]GBR69281.1 hypothetical protein AA0312_1318 [Acetobacter tropicalis NRIC 0312]GEL64826.1 hypothetical protein KBA01_21120 [Kozakia baliensis]